MSQQLDPNRKIEGSYIFTGPMSQKGYALNKLGASLMSDERARPSKMMKKVICLNSGCLKSKSN